MNQKIANVVTKLQQSVNAIGINNDLRPALENNIQKKADRFNLALETEIGSDRLAIKLHFVKEGTDFGFPAYQATLLHPTPIAHAQFNGIDTQKLECRMKNADWHYGIAESETEVIKGYKNIEAIEADLRQLSQDELGGTLAVQLWKNNVPANTVAKPTFISRIEAEHNLYPSGTFSARNKVGEACGILKVQCQVKQLATPDSILTGGHLTEGYRFPNASEQNQLCSKPETSIKDSMRKHRRRLE